MEANEKKRKLSGFYCFVLKFRLFQRVFDQLNLLRYCGIKVDFCKYNQDLKDKVDALSKEITQLKEKVRVDSAITFGAEAAATSGNSNNNASNDETVSRSLQQGV